MYIWFVKMDGTMGVKNMTVPVDVPSGTIFENLEPERTFTAGLPLSF